MINLSKIWYFFLFSAIFISWQNSKHTDIADKTALGKRLFFDPILSSDSSLSCASCHKPEFAFADNVPISPGVRKAKSKRNAPSVMNMSARPYFFFDGRAATLEDQVLHPIQDPAELNLPLVEVDRRLSRHDGYSKAFINVFGVPYQRVFLQEAIAEFVRSLETDDTDNDRWLRDEMPGLQPIQIRGRALFFGKAKCAECHFTPDFTDDGFKNIGLFDGIKYRDSGRARITKKVEDLGKFKTPGLRNIERTAPYMHDGSFKTLEKVIDFYDNPSKFVPNAINRDTLFNNPLNLTKLEKREIIAFLKALTDDRFRKAKK